MLLGLVGALLAAIAYGVATIAQAVGVRRLDALPEDAAWQAKAVAGRLYAVGLALDGIGFLASVGALRSLPLFLVQSAVASSVAVTALLAVWFLGARLGRREVFALVGVLVGLVLLAASAREGVGRALPGPAAWTLLGSVVALVVLAVAGSRSGVVLAAVSGLAFGLVGVAARGLVIPHPWWHLLGDPLLWALVGHGVLGAAAYGFALARSPVTTVAAMTFSVETVVPALIGLAFLGDGIRPHFGVVAVVGFAVTVLGSIALAAYAEPVAGDQA